VYHRVNALEDEFKEVDHTNIKSQIEHTKTNVSQIHLWLHDAAELLVVRCKTCEDYDFEIVMMRVNKEVLCVGNRCSHRFIFCNAFEYTNSDGSSSDFFGAWNDKKGKWVVKDRDLEIWNVLRVARDRYIVGCYDDEH
jgi:hypothetical protein